MDAAPHPKPMNPEVVKAFQSISAEWSRLAAIWRDEDRPCMALLAQSWACHTAQSARDRLVGGE